MVTQLVSGVATVVSEDGLTDAVVWGDGSLTVSHYQPDGTPISQVKLDQATTLDLLMAMESPRVTQCLMAH